jgi:glycosyltransferase 2 family protein
VTLRPQLRRAAFWLGLVVSGLFAYLAVRGVDLDRVWVAFRNCSYWTLAPALALIALANVIRAWRWQLQFARETRPRFGPALRALLLGTFFNNVLPARAGEAAQVVALRRSSRTSLSETAATVLLGRAYDVLSVLVLLFVLAPWLPPVSWLRAAVYLALGLVAGLLLLLALGQRLLRLTLRPLSRLPFLSAAHADSAAAGAWRGLVSLRRPLPAAIALVLTAASWIVFGFSNWFVLEGFSLGLSPLAGILVSIALSLALILPSSPAAVGVFEAAVLVALRPYGVPKVDALSAALLLHAVNLFPYIAAGLYCLQQEARSRSVEAPSGRPGLGGEG